MEQISATAPSTRDPLMDTPAIDPETEKLLLEPFRYLAEHPGKEIRTQMIKAFDLWLRVPQEKLSLIRDVIEMLHTASLLIDDVEDDSELRRGVPVAHKVYGVPATINCANLVYFKAFQLAMKLDHPDVVKIFTEELINLHHGQGLEIYWRDNCICPTENEYVVMVGHKTGGLLRLAVKLMQTFSEEKKSDYVPLVNILGIHFQVRDDYINLRSDKYMEGKSFCEDLTEGKFSFPIVHSIRAEGNQNRQLLNILKQHTTSIDLKKYALECMHRTDSFKYTANYLRNIENKAREEVERLGGNSHLVAIIDLLAAAYASG